MRPRDLFVLCGITCLCLMAGVLLLGEETQAGIEPRGLTETPPAASMAPSEPAALPAAAPDAVDAPALATSRETKTDTTGWTRGIIRGDIQLAVSVMDKLSTLTVVVEEARSGFVGDTYVQPTRLMVPVPLGLGTPTFEVRDVPFSEYPYFVSVLAPGLNGSRSTLTIDKDHAFVDNIVLRVTPGAPFTVLIRDQDAAPYAGLDVLMVAVGLPHGRGKHAGKTNNFGSVTFDCVLAGDYQVTYLLNGQALAEPQGITVQPGSRAVVQGQSHAVTIARGVPLQVEVHDRAGYTIADAKVTATAKDRIRLTALELTTDGLGRCLFSHLQPGEWQITIERDGFERKDLALSLQPDVRPDMLRVLLLQR